MIWLYDLDYIDIAHKSIQAILYTSNNSNLLQVVITLRPCLRLLNCQYHSFTSKNLRTYVNKGSDFLKTNIYIKKAIVLKVSPYTLLKGVSLYYTQKCHLVLCWKAFFCIMLGGRNLAFCWEEIVLQIC